MNLPKTLAEAHLEIEDLRKQLEEFRVLATIDPLTGCLNRRAGEAAIEEAINRHERNDTPYCLVMLDLDHFKEVNDNEEWGGHANGDRVLKHVARVLKGRIRKTDKIIRWGGEEFLIVTENDLSGGVKLAEAIRVEIRDNVFKDSDERNCQTASLGVGYTVDEADKAMYQAKRTGRNKVIYA
jgi:diguanylate cyclase